MPKWVWVIVVIIVLALFVLPNPTGSGSAVGDAINAVATFFRSLAASIRG